MQDRNRRHHAVTGSAPAHRAVLTPLLAVLMGLASSAQASEDAPHPEWLERHPDTALRVLAWNVDRAFFERNDGFQQVLRAADADILILDEMPPGVSAAKIADGLPAGSVRWQAVYGSGGGEHQRASIAALAPLQRVPELDHVAYPPERIREWLRPVPAQARQRARETLEAGVAAVGAVVEIGGLRLLVVGVDLQCCGDTADSPEELRRQFESKAIRDAIDGVAESLKVDAIVVGGDFNAVQGNTPVAIMQQGARQSDTLAEADARHRGSNAADWTWDGRGTPYPSRQLDFLLHSDRLRVLQAQIFDTEDLSPEVRKALGLGADLSGSLSPHRPVVVDFGRR